MSAALLSALPAEANLDQTAVARFLLAMHPFTAARFVAQWLNSPIKTILHRDTPALVLDESEHLYRILTDDDFENKGEPFWIYRESAKQEKNDIESFWRDRSGETLAAPCWHGEERPKGHRNVRLKTEFPSLKHLLRLAALGYLWDSAVAALPRAHKPWMCPVADRRSNGVIDKSDDDDKDDEKTGIKNRDYHKVVDVSHPYIPMAPSRRTHVGGGISMAQVMREIAKHHWDDTTSSCVLRIVYRRESPLKLSEEHGVPLRRLHEYARQIRKAIKSNPENAFAQ
jgi:hypothetical protein